MKMGLLFRTEYLGGQLRGLFHQRSSPRDYVLGELPSALPQIGYPARKFLNLTGDQQLRHRIDYSADAGRPTLGDIFVHPLFGPS